MSTKLNLINNSQSPQTNVVIFQKNIASGFNELAVAWKVIENIAQGDNCPFTFSMDMKICASDAWGNYTPQLSAYNGQLFHVTKGPSGNAFSAAGTATSQNMVQLRNGLQQGAIDASIFKNGSLLATKTSLAPGQTAAFSFEPSIWIGVVNRIAEGAVMNSAVLSQINTEIALLGIASADIIMTGGGPGPVSALFTFRLDNIIVS